MCSRLHAIGFPCEIDRRTAEFIVSAAASRRRVQSPAGEYRIWRSPAGAEVWLHYARQMAGDASQGSGGGGSEHDFDAIDDLTGVSVVHGGTSELKVRLARALAVSSKNPLEGVGVGTIGSLRSGDKRIAFTFELIGFAAEAITRPFEARVQVTALAQRVWAYATETAYLAATPASRLIGRGAIADVVPGDLPDVRLVYRPLPGSLWLLTGTVARSLRLKNPVTSEPYYWISLETDRGDFDVVAHPSVIDGDVSTGHVVQAVADLSGRILERLS